MLFNIFLRRGFGEGGYPCQITTLSSVPFAAHQEKMATSVFLCLALNPIPSSNHTLFSWRRSPLKAHILLPLHTKLIVMLREPLSRAISGFFQMNRHGIPLIFEDSVQMELNVMLQCETDVPNIEERYSECIWPKVVENSLTETLSNASGWWSDSWETTSTPKMCLSNAINHGTTLLRGLYYYQLRDWLETFGADRIMVLLSDTFFKSPVKTTEKAIKYVSQHQSAAYVAAAARQSKRGQNKILASAENATLRNSRTPEDFRISTELQTKLREVYQPYNELLYTLLDEHNIPYTRFS